jgi:hypothetical protein
MMATVRTCHVFQVRRSFIFNSPFSGWWEIASSSSSELAWLGVGGTPYPSEGACSEARGAVWICPGGVAVAAEGGPLE